MSEPASIFSGIALRYATAVYDLAKETKSIKAIEADVSALSAALDMSSELADFIGSPVYTRDQMRDAISALAGRMELSGIMTNALCLMAQKRRLFVIPALLEALRAMIAWEKGEVTAQVRTAKALTKVQEGKLAKVLGNSIGKRVSINATVDESLIGGLIVKLGSKMIDTSIASRLSSLQNKMKEVG